MSYYINGRLDVGGRATDALAKAYAADHHVDYSQALCTVVKQANQSYAQKINRATARYQQEGSLSPNGIHFKVFEDSAGNVMELQLDNSGQGVTRLGNIICGLPRNDDHSVNVELALRIIRSEFPEIGKEAAGGFLAHRAQIILRNSQPAEGVTPEIALRRAMAEFPEVSRVYNGSTMTEQALRLINAPLFKTPQPEAPLPNERSYTREATYESVRRYEYTPTQK